MYNDVLNDILKSSNNKRANSEHSRIRITASKFVRVTNFKNSLPCHVREEVDSSIETMPTFFYSIIYSVYDFSAENVPAVISGSF